MEKKKDFVSIEVQHAGSLLNIPSSSAAVGWIPALHFLGFAFRVISALADSVPSKVVTPADNGIS